MNFCTRISVFCVLVLSLSACKSNSQLDGKYNAMVGEQETASKGVDPSAQKPKTPSATSEGAKLLKQKGVPKGSSPKTVVWTPDYSKSKIAFVGAKLSGEHHGHFQHFQLSATSEDGKPASVQFSVEMASVVADNEKLTAHLKSPDFFDAANHPQATFVSESIVPTGNAVHEYQVKGKLTLRGVSATIAFPAIVWLYSDYAAATLTSEFTINRKAFGVVYPGKPDDLIKDAVLITLYLELKSSTP